MSNGPFNLELLARRVMIQSGLRPEFSVAELKELQAITNSAPKPAESQDLRSLLWCSIDNDDSRDLDQLTYAQLTGDGRTTTIWIAVADVDALVHKDSAIDLHAQINTTSVYTPAKIFPMLPTKLSTDLTSLNENEDRVAMVIKIIIDPDGKIQESSIFQAYVHNHAKLTYSAVGAWLEGRNEPPIKVAKVPGMEAAIKCQHQVAQLLKKRRHELGALTLESSEPEAKVMDNSQVVLELAPHNAAHQLIEHFMIAANSAIANHFHDARIPSIRRVVRTPKRWDRIVKIAADLGETLPEQPDPKALDSFLINRKHLDPVTFPDLSLAIIKLLGSGEYVVEIPGEAPIGHFGLALREYTHSTAPNRRFPDLITQRQYKSFIRKESSPYTLKELQKLANHCTKQEDAATKVERHMVKSAAAMLLSSMIGTTFKGIITGAGQKGTWVRIFDPPVEGKVVKGFEKLDVGDQVSVKLVSTSIPEGYIDFVH
jgi:exoribonuclease-2